MFLKVVEPPARLKSSAPRLSIQSCCCQPLVETGCQVQHSDRLFLEPTSNKFKGTLCKGFQIHVTDPYKFKPYITTLRLLQAVIFNHIDQFRWKLPPYEYEFKKYPIDLIIGNKNIRQRIENLDNIENIEKSWIHDLKEFIEISRKYHLYT